MTFEIRPLSPADAGAFMTLRRQALVDSPAAFSSSPEDDRASSPAFVERMLAGEGESSVFGAFAPELVGVLGLHRDDSRKTSHKVHMWGMFVSPARRRQGAGRRLLSAAVAHARTLPGVTQAQLTVSEAAPAARALYESCGFRVWGEEPRALYIDGRFFAEYHLTLLLDSSLT